jgi:formiminoglutamase
MNPLSIAPPPSVFYQGRPGDPRLGEWVVRQWPNSEKGKNPVRAVLFGYPDDQGVTLNRGRKGAAGGPDSIRAEFYKMAVPGDSNWNAHRFLADAGNIPVSSDLRQTHLAAQALAHAVAQSGAVGIALGGGHDFAACTFKGFVEASSKKSTWGLINVDPHLDTRPMESDVPHSGNPFRVILESKKLSPKNLVQFGARPNRNSHATWQYCVDQKVRILPFESTLTPSPLAQFKKALSQLSTKVSRVGLTIDMDACCEAEGMSAPPVLGFTARELYSMAFVAGQNRKVAYLEVAEVAPELDSQRRSSRIAAEVVFAFLSGRAPLIQ